MLEIYKNLFAALEREGCAYCIYKGLNHLQDDLNGIRGDIDILVPFAELARFVEIALGCGFLKGTAQPGLPIYMYGRDKRTMRYIMLDIDVSFRFGHKPYRPLRLDPNWGELSIAKQSIGNGHIRVLAKKDYLALMLLMRITVKAPKQEDFDELKVSLLKLGKCSFPQSYCGRLALDACGVRAEELFSVFQKSRSWTDFYPRFHKPVLYSLAGGRRHYIIKVSLETLLGLAKKIWFAIGRRIFRWPIVRIPRGRMIAIVGTDGAGKSSTIAHIVDDPFYSRLGARRIYFGHNEFWFPLVDRMESWKTIPGLGTLHNLIRKFDRQMRLLPALYFRYVGSIVLCDRFYYDDQLQMVMANSRAPENSTIARLRKGVGYFLRPRMWVRPDLTIFLNVSPEVAYARKPDHKLECLEKGSREWRDFMTNRKEVTVIDADRDRDAVLKDVYDAIGKLVFEEAEP